MRRRLSLPVVALGVALAAAVAHASGPSSGPSNPSPAPELPTDRAMTPAEREALVRQEAEDQYEKGRRELEKAEQEFGEAQALLAAGDEKSAEKAKKKEESARKKFGKAADNFREATVVWPAHADAWNLLGYCLRRQDRLEEAFDAYWHCLEIDPEHAGAHEYLGEAWLQAGRPEQAANELAWLERRKAPEAEALRQAIARYRSVHPTAAAPDTAATALEKPAVADTASGTR